ncbi:MAG: tetratricopeptide repeat protein [Vicinamibacteria bacterium]
MLRRFLCALAVALIVSPAFAQLESVGSLRFETSAGPEAQKHFLRGVAILHSFGWKQAIAEFQAAQKLEPDFALAYWGETLCYNHPLGDEQDGKTPREVLARLGDTPEARLAKAKTAREKGFLQAVEALWAEGDDWRARRVAYMNAMERLHQQYPDDVEVTTLYAVSILSGARALEDSTFRLEVKAGALAMDVFQRHPDHPGAAHYIIHSFDDPIHAPLALRAADAYAAIAPAVSHAIHMPTHIFIQHGMWEKVSLQNMRAHEVASELWKSGDSMSDMRHSLDWGQYGFLQRGDYAKAKDAIERFEEMAGMSDKGGAGSGFALAKARYIIETEEWKAQELADDASKAELLANGMSAARTGDLKTAEEMAKRLAEKASSDDKAEAGGGGHAGHGGTPPPPSDDDLGVEVMHQEVAALLALAQGKKDEAVALLRKAVSIEDRMRPPNGAADPAKPSHELLGEVLLETGNPAEAAKAFDASLLRMPNRARSLLGSARAHAAAGDRAKASERFAKLLEIWSGHPELAGYQEAQRFVSATDEN